MGAVGGLCICRIVQRQFFSCMQDTFFLQSCPHGSRYVQLQTHLPQYNANGLKKGGCGKIEGETSLHPSIGASLVLQDGKCDKINSAYLDQFFIFHSLGLPEARPSALP